MSKMKVTMVLDTPDASKLETVLSHHAEYLIDCDNNADIISGISNVECEILKDWKEVKKLPKIKDDGPIDIAGWLTDDPMEEGTIIAKVFPPRNSLKPTVVYCDNAAKIDSRVQQIVEELKKEEVDGNE